MMKRITVFCGSSAGFNSIYQQEAFALGQLLAERNIGIIYGGAKVGLMGAVADGALSKNGEVIGVLPHFLRKKELVHEAISQIIVTETMHERKMKMFELSDGVITLPGGFGTLDEIFEMLTWGQLGLHKLPIALLNVNGYYDDFSAQIQKMVDHGFLKIENQQMLLVSDQIGGLLTLMENYQAPEVGKWLKKEEI